MNDNASSIISKVWSFCNTLRDDGVGYGDYIDKEEKGFLKYKTFYGNEIVAGARRLALMNMFLHNIGDIDSETFISPTDSLVADSGLRVNYVLTNPPFGKKSSMTFTNEEGKHELASIGLGKRRPMHEFGEVAAPLKAREK